MTDTDKDLEQLLPFYANGTLEGEEKERVESRLAEDAEFAQELEYLKALRTKIKEEEVNSPGDFGLARLNREIDQELTENTAPQAANDNQGWRVTAIAAAIALMLSVGVHIYGNVFEKSDYITASGTHQVEGPVMQVFFKEDAFEAEIRTLLIAEKLTIIEGPTEVGYYRIAAKTKLTDEETKALLARLSSSTLVSEALRE